MWGAGADFVQEVVLGALKTWQSEQQDYLGEVASRIEDDPTGYGAEIYRDLRHATPEIADLVRDEARLLQPVRPMRLHPASPGSTVRLPPDDMRATVIAGAITATLEGGEEAVEAVRDLAHRRGNPTDLVDATEAVRQAGGGVSNAERLTALDRCTEAVIFDRLVAQRDLLREILTMHLDAITADFPSFESALSGVLASPELTGAMVAVGAIDGLAVELRQEAGPASSNASTQAHPPVASRS